MTSVVRGMAMENNDAEGRTRTDVGNHDLKQMVRESRMGWWGGAGGGV